MELPPYKWPSVRIVWQRVLDQSRAFLVRAGTLIFAVTVLVWAAGYFPVDHSELHAVQTEQEQIEENLTQLETIVENASEEEKPDARLALEEAEEEVVPRLEELEGQEKRLSAQAIRESYLGQTGKFVEPVVKPLGWDWRLGVGAIASFPAREVIIATMGTIFSLGGDVDEEDPTLVETLRSATWPDGSPLITIPVALSIMVFFALCAQCGATLMVIRRETNTWRWPVFTFVYMTVLAYVGAFAVYQVTSQFWG